MSNELVMAFSGNCDSAVEEDLLLSPLTEWANLTEVENKASMVTFLRSLESTHDDNENPAMMHALFKRLASEHKLTWPTEVE